MKLHLLFVLYMFIYVVEIDFGVLKINQDTLRGQRFWLCFRHLRQLFGRDPRTKNAPYRRQVVMRGPPCGSLLCSKMFLTSSRARRIENLSPGSFESMILGLGELIVIRSKSEVVGPKGTVEQYGKFDCLVDHESSETVSSFGKY
ncbi:hypothetical protein L3X38_037162 [Prunus dulcis]|uniref:Uncharacterized protein n=1 Tax=Prunus dulcis TaxID=3755 RepID=A0AAD4YQD9_PRUDU|nr:hypothetical protein L3X38_037162 [Prunus dulcis]